MRFKTNDVSNELKSKLRYNQLLLLLALLGTVITLIMLSNYIFVPILFILFGSLSLPNINKCKADLDNVDKNNFITIKGEVVDYFPESTSDNNKLWILFILIEDSVQEVFFKTDVKLEKNNDIEIKVTPNTKIPVEILQVSQI